MDEKDWEHFKDEWEARWKGLEWAAEKRRWAMDATDNNKLFITHEQADRLLQFMKRHSLESMDSLLEVLENTEKLAETMVKRIKDNDDSKER